MTDFLTQRGGVWHFVRRVPHAYSLVDKRGIVRQSTRIKVRDDRLGRQAARVADTYNRDLERAWRARSPGHGAVYDDVRHRARDLGFEFVDNEELLRQPLEKLLLRLEALVERNLLEDAGARSAILGIAKPTNGFLLSQLFSEYEQAVLDEVRDFSADQLRIWRVSHTRAASQFLNVCGDKPITELTDDDAIEYSEWWRSRVVKGEVAAKTANRDIGQLSAMIKALSTRRRLKIPDLFKGLRLKNETEKSRLPFDNALIRRLLDGAMDGMNEDARLAILALIETGLRLSEILNLRRDTIHLDAPIPYVRVIADGRRLKTVDSEREIPLVGVALAVMKLRPDGFPSYRDRASSLSATVNKYLSNHGLRPTPDHSVYSLRHSFKDRLVAAEAPDSLIDNCMGHRTGKPKYGRGPSLELKVKFLERIAFPPPWRL